MNESEQVKETLQQTFDSILDEIFAGNSKLGALQKYIDSPGSQAADPAPALAVIGAIKQAKLRNQRSGLLVNFTTGLAINIADIIGGAETAKKVSAAASDGNPRLIQLYTASAAGVIVEAFQLGKHQDLWKLTGEQLPNSFVAHLFQQHDDVTKFLRANLPVIFPPELPKAPDLAFHAQLADALNELLGRQSIYEESRFSNITLSPRLTKLLTKTLPIQEYPATNRLLLEAAYPRDFTRRKLVSNFFERRPDLRSVIVISKPYSWLADNNVETYEAMCQTVGMPSPNEVTAIGAGKAVVRNYKKLPPAERSKFVAGLRNEIPELQSTLSSNEIVSMTRAALANGSDTERQKMKDELFNIVGLPEVIPVTGVAPKPLAEQPNTLLEAEREKILAPSSVPELNWEELVARARKLLEQCPESERAGKFNLIKPLADLINPIEMALIQSSDLANTLSSMPTAERDKLLAEILPQLSGKTTVENWLSNTDGLLKSVEKEKRLLLLESATGLLAYGEAKDALRILTQQLRKTLSVLSDGDRKREVEELRKSLSKPAGGEPKPNAKQNLDDDLTVQFKFAAA